LDKATARAGDYASYAPGQSQERYKGRMFLRPLYKCFRLLRRLIKFYAAGINWLTILLLPPQYMIYAYIHGKEPLMWAYIFFTKTKPHAFLVYLYNIEGKIYVRKELNKMEPERLVKLVHEAKQGNMSTLEELCMDAFGNVYRLALRILKNPEDAEDITQEVFNQIQQKISDLRDPAAFYAWANKITANKCNRFFGRHKGLISLDDEEELLSIPDDDPENMPDRALDDEASRKIIMTVIDNLPDKQRICILLFYYGQLTVMDIAVALETNENTVKTRLSMARAKIRTALEEKAEKEGIKLWGLPIVLAPIIREAMERMIAPLEVQAQVRNNITDDTAEYSRASPGDTAANGTALSTSAIVLIICGAVLAAAIAATAIFWPQEGEIFPQDGYAVYPGIHPQHAIAAGNSHSLVIDSGGSLRAWGNNLHGQLGDNTIERRLVPAIVTDDFMAISAGGTHSLAICADGGLWAWDSNNVGQLGDGTAQGSDTPIKIMDDVVYISASRRIQNTHSLAVTADGGLWAWGSNTQGRLGTGGGGGSRYPVRVMDDIVAVSAGDFHSLALGADGGLWAWGSGRSGRIGDGTAGGTRVSPVRIKDDIVAISAGNHHSLAVTSDGGLWVWGYNRDGRLGDGTTENRYYPVRILDLAAN